MRIDLLTTELRTGGAERCLTALALGLHNRGDRVRVLSLGRLPKSPRDELLNQLVGAGIEVRSAEAEGIWSLRRTITRIIRRFGEDPPEVLQTFLYHGNMVGTFAGVAAGVPVRVGGVRVAQPHPGRWLSERCAVRRMQGLVCVSRSVEQFAQRRLRPPATTRVVTIPNGVRVELLGAAPPRDWIRDGLQPASRVLLFVGRLHHQKGLDLLLREAPELLRRHPDAALAIVGSGPMEAEARRVVSQLPGGRAILLPWETNIASLYAGAEIVVVPSRFEGMPNVILEAMAAGRPVAAAEVEGVAELLGEATDQQTFPPEDASALVARIDYLLREADLRQLGTANHRRAAESFSLQTMVERYRRLYEELLAR